MSEQCTKRVRGSDCWHLSQCTRKAKVFVDGVGYCTQHSPEKEAERKAKRDRKEEKDEAQRVIKWAQRRLGKLVTAYFSSRGYIKLTPPMRKELGIIEDAKDVLKE